MLDVQTTPLSDHEAWITELIRAGGLDLARRSEIYRAITSTPAVYVDKAHAFALPFAISAREWRDWASASERLVALVWDVVARKLATDGPAFLASLGVNAPLMAQLDRTPRPASLDEVLARPDFFLGPEGPRFLETNIDSSLGGLGTAAPLARVYCAQGVARGLTLNDPTPALAAQMRRMAGRPLGGLHAAIVDWHDEIDDVPWPYDRMAEDLAVHGIKAVTAGPRDLAVRDETALWTHGAPVDLVYRGITPVARLWRDPGAFDPLWAASRRTPILASLWCVAFSSKAVLAWLWQMAFADELPARECAFVRRHIPWTALAADETCQGPDGGVPVALETFVRRQQADLVIKSPSDGSCKNVTVGRYVSAARWREVYEVARATPGYVVQAYVAPNLVTNAAPEGADELTSSYACNFSVFVFGDQAAGTCIRGTAQESPFISCMHGAREGVAMTLSEVWNAASDLRTPGVSATFERAVGG